MEREYETATEALEDGAVIAAVDTDWGMVVVWFGPPDQMLHLFTTGGGGWREVAVRTIGSVTLDYDAAVGEGQEWMRELIEEAGEE